MSTSIILVLVFGCVAVILIGLALFFLFRTRSFIGKARETKGTITDMVYSSDSEGGGYTPVFRFRTLEGQEIEIRGSLRTNPPQFKVGQTIDVLYEPENPSGARIKKWLNLYFVPLLLGFLGVVFGCVGVGVTLAELLGFF